LSSACSPNNIKVTSVSVDDFRWYEKAGLRRDAISSQVIEALRAQEIKETGSEEDYHQNDMSE
jgi:hypothetical protein